MLFHERKFKICLIPASLHCNNFWIAWWLHHILFSDIYLFIYLFYWYIYCFESVIICLYQYQSFTLNFPFILMIRSWCYNFHKHQSTWISLIERKWFVFIKTLPTLTHLCFVVLIESIMESRCTIGCEGFTSKIWTSIVHNNCLNLNLVDLLLAEGVDFKNLSNCLITF